MELRSWMVITGLFVFNAWLQVKVKANANTGLQWPDVYYFATKGGDADDNYTCDGADFVIWQTNFPSSNQPITQGADFDKDGDVDGADFVIWDTNQGTELVKITAPYELVRTIGYEYEPRGLRATMTDPDGGVTSYSHDPAGRLEWLVNPQGERTTLSYDADNRLLVKRLANGARTSIIYDAANRLLQTYTFSSSGSVIASGDNAYDAVGNRTSSLESTGGRVTWTYDPTYQLINEHRSGMGAVNVTHSYDPVGNRLVQQRNGARTTFSYDVANQLKTSVDASGLTTYTFDPAGNQQLVVAPGNARTTSVWNDENRQVQLLLPDGKITTSIYRADGLRRGKHDSSGITYYVFDGQNYLQETDGENVTQAQFTNTPDQFGRLVSQSRQSGAIWTPSYYLFDAVGSTRLLLAADQSPSDTYWYEAFGNLLAATGSTLNPFRYIGEYGYYFDQDSGNYYVREREYRPVIITWLSIDPLGFDAGDVNWYRYVGGNPINATDPSGKLVPAVLAGLATAIAACGFPYHEAAHNMYPDSGDKFKHCWVSCQMGKTCTGILAQYGGLGKEAIDIVKGILGQKHPGFEDTLDDLNANQQCVYWEEYIPVICWTAFFLRESCFDCCSRKVGYKARHLPR